MKPLLVLIAVTAVWGVTFVQVTEAVALYPLFAFLSLRFAIAALTLAPPAARRVRTLDRSGWAAAIFAGVLLGAGFALQTAGLERTSVSSTGFITGMYVVLTTLLALAIFRTRAGLPVWIGVALTAFGLALLSGFHGTTGWIGCAVIMAGIAVSEPQAAGVLARLVRRP